MPIKNYTTTIAPIKTIGEISKILHEHGARKILQEYGDNGEIKSVSFSVDTPQGEAYFRLPANVDGVLIRLQEDQTPKRDRDQAERTAWRILYAWIVAQMAIIEANMAAVEEVFLPYMITAGNQTVYEAFKTEQLKLMGDAQ
jgi:hypothetical protein